MQTVASTSNFSVIVFTEDDVPGAKLTGKTVEENTNDHLKRWLKCRGLKTFGKRADIMKR